MESQDYAEQKQEQKEHDEREFYENAKAEMNEAFENVISQAYEDGLEEAEILISLENALMDCTNGKAFKIKVMEF